jgi:hypothetical protein
MIRRYQRALMSLVLAGAALMLTAPVRAHHAVTPFYEENKTVAIQGVVKKFIFKNPHSLLVVDVKDEKGETTEWEIELGAPIILGKAGWTPDTIKVGDEIKATGRPSKAPGTHGLSSMAGATVTRADGKSLGPEDAGRGRGRGTP